MRFDGKVVLITGAAGGFGARTAECFAETGARLVLSDLDERGLTDVAGGLDADTVTLAGDVTDPSFHDDLVDLALAEFGALDVAVNNAGIVSPMARIPATDAALARAVIEVDLLGVFWALQAQRPVMASRFADEGPPGAIVNIASAAGLVGSPCRGISAPAKHAVGGPTRPA